MLQNLPKLFIWMRVFPLKLIFKRFVELGTQFVAASDLGISQQRSAVKLGTKMMNGCGRMLLPTVYCVQAFKCNHSFCDTKNRWMFTAMESWGQKTHVERRIDELKDQRHLNIAGNTVPKTNRICVACCVDSYRKLKTLNVSIPLVGLLHNPFIGIIMVIYSVRHALDANVFTDFTGGAGVNSLLLLG